MQTEIMRRNSCVNVSGPELNLNVTNGTEQTTRFQHCRPGT